MKAKPFKLVQGEGYIPSTVEDCTHVKLNIPGITGVIHLPVILKGTRDGTGCWSWNGDVDTPTLRPSVKTTWPANPDAEEDFKEWRTERVCHSWINDGNVVFLDDCTHEFKGQTVPLIEID